MLWKKLESVQLLFPRKVNHTNFGYILDWLEILKNRNYENESLKYELNDS